MKAIKINNEIKVFEELPKKWILEDGSKINNFRGASNEQLEDLGFKDVIKPELQDGKMYASNLEVEDFYSELNAYVWQVIDIPTLTAEELTELKNSYVKLIESDTDNLIKDVVGYRTDEYAIAEQEAIEFKNAGYPENDIPQSVSSDAIANNRTNQEACDLILLMAENWRTVQAQIRANRLMTKAQIKSADSEESIETILGVWNTFLSNIRNQIIE